MKRALTPSDEDGEEQKGESEGSVKEEAPTPCTPQGTVPKKDKLKEKRRKRKERMKAARSGHRWEEIIPDSPLCDYNSYDASFWRRYGQ